MVSFNRPNCIETHSNSPASSARKLLHTPACPAPRCSFWAGRVCRAGAFAVWPPGLRSLLFPQGDSENMRLRWTLGEQESVLGKHETNGNKYIMFYVCALRCLHAHVLFQMPPLVQRGSRCAGGPHGLPQTAPAMPDPWDRVSPWRGACCLGEMVAGGGDPAFLL